MVDREQAVTGVFVPRDRVAEAIGLEEDLVLVPYVADDPLRARLPDPVSLGVVLVALEENSIPLHLDEEVAGVVDVGPQMAVFCLGAQVAVRIVGVGGGRGSSECR